MRTPILYSRLIILIALFFFSYGASAQIIDTTIIDFNVYSGTCVCNSDYSCYTNHTSTFSSSYTGKRLVGLKFKFFFVGCGTGAHLALLNGDTMGSFTPTNDCSCSKCYIDSIEVSDFTSLSAYNLNGTNTFQFKGVQLCADKILIIRSFVPTVANNAAMVKIDAPYFACPGSNDVKVTIGNFGNNPIDSVDVNWTYNGTAQTTYRNTARLDTFGGSGSSFLRVTLGSKVLVKGKTDTLVVWTSSPNGATDSVNYDDTLRGNITPALSGTFTVGGSSPDYTNIQDAINDLNQFGVCGPVVLSIRTGSYNEQLILKPIPGASDTNNITIKSASNDSSLVNIYYASSSSLNYTMFFDIGASFYNIEQVSMEATDSYYARVVTFGGNNQNIQFNNCQIIGKVVNSSNSNQALFYKPSVSARFEDLTIRNCLLLNGSYGCYFSNSVNTNIVIEGNVFSNQYYTNFYEEQGYGLRLNNNLFTSTSAQSYGYGIYVYDIDSMQFFNNNVDQTGKDHAAYFDYVYGSKSNPAQIYNNFFSNNFTASNMNCYGVYLYGCSYVNFSFNSLQSNSNSEASALVVGYGDNQNFFNNSISRVGPGWGLDHESSSIGTNIFNHNNYFSSTGSTIRKGGTTYRSLSSWRSATSQDSASVSANPLYIGNNDLHTQNVSMNGHATPLSNITRDIDGEVRDSTTPDIGADEFDIPKLDAGITQIFSLTADSICVNVVLQNMGKDTLKSVKIALNINGIAVSPLSWSGNLLSGDTTVACLGYRKFAQDTLYNLTAWTYDPNGQTDSINYNDTSRLSAYPALNGVYTIGGSSPDFTTFTSAVNALKTYGILDSVRFRVRNGTYSERLDIPNIMGAYDENDVVFESESLDSSKVILAIGVNSSTNYVIKLDDASGITFRHITIKSINTGTYSRVIHVTENASNLNFSHNYIGTNQIVSTDVYSASLVYFEYKMNYNVSFDRNRFVGGSNSVYAYYVERLNFVNNFIDSQYNYGVYLYRIYGDCKISRNRIQTHSNYAGYNALYTYTWEGSGEVSFNMITGPNKQERYGFYLGNQYVQSAGDTVFIFNNMVSVGGNYTFANAMYLGYTEAAVMANNSMHYYGSDTTNSHALYVGYVDFLQSYNNNVANGFGGYPFYLSDPYQPIYFDHNNYFSPSGGVCDISGDQFQDFSELHSYELDSNSIAENPNFASNTDLHASSSSLDKKAMPLPFVTVDFDDEARSSTPDIGADEFVVPTLDISPIAFVSPENSINAGSTRIKIAVRNSGIDTVYSFKAQAIVNMDTMSVVSVADTLFPGDTVHIAFGNYTFLPDSINNITAWTFSPNNSTDLKVSNDTIKIIDKLTSLSGVYTIGGTNPDFKTFKLAVAAMVEAGIADSVRFRVRSGTYTEQIIIPPIVGAGARNSIIFESEAYDSTAVTLSFNSTKSDTNFVVFLNGADGVTFRKMTLKSLSSSYGRIFMFQNGANYNTLTSLKLEAPTLTFTGSDVSLVFSDYATLTDEYNQFANNTFLNGGYGIYFLGPNGGTFPNYFERGNDISGNKFLNQYGYPIVLRYQNAQKIKRNTLINNNTSNNGDGGINIAGCYGKFEITNNFIQRANRAYYGIYGYGFSNEDSSLIANNFIDIGYSGSSINGIYMEQLDYCNIIYNTVRIRAGSIYSTPLYLYYGSNNQVLNNVLENASLGYAIYLNSSSILKTSNYNNLRTAGVNLVYYNGSNYPNLASYVSASQKDSNSISANPEFVGADDLHTKSLDLNGAATPSKLIKLDFDGELRDSVSPDIGADEFTPPPVDAGISDIISPKTPFLSDTQYVAVVLRNFGSVNLTSATIEWTLNGSAGTAVNWTGSLATGDTVHIALSRVFFSSDSAYSLISWSRLPNNINDTINQNDTAKAINQFPALRGVYTIGGASPDFNTFNDAISALNRGGMIDSVVFNVRNGTYNEQLRFGKIIGANRTDAIVFQSESGDSSQVILNSINQTNAKNYVVYMDSVTGITFRNLSITGGNNSYSRLVQINGSSKNVTFTNNYIKGSNYSTTSNAHSAIYIYSTSGNNDSIVISNNAISGSTGIYHYGYYSGVYDKRFRITNNTINFYYTGIYTYYSDTSIISQNDLKSGTYSSANGLLAYYMRFYKVTANRIEITNGSYGMSLEQCDANSTKRSLLANNMVYVGSNNTVYGLYISNCDYYDFYNNNINVTSTSVNSRTLYENYGSNVRSNNNVLKAWKGYAMYVNSTTTFIESNNNCFYTSGTNLAYYNGNRTNLSSLQSANSRDGSSVSVDPQFVAANDLHVRAIDLNENGKLLSLITTDFDGEVRDTLKPDIGADEFEIPGPNDAGISKYIGPQVPFTSGSQVVKVILTNFGSDTLKSAKLNWTLNGATQTSSTWTGIILSGKSDTVSLGSYSFSAGVNHTVKAWSSLPNGVTDSFSYNDSLTKTGLFCALAGTYTIGGTLPDFGTINEAISALHIGGISDTVTFNIRNGTYYEQVKLVEYPGSNSSRPVVFQSESGDSSKVIISYGSGYNNNYVWNVNGADQIKIRKITIKPIAYYYNNGLVINNGSQNGEISNCNIINNDPYPYYTSYGIYSTSDQDNNWLISNNDISKFYYGILMYGNSGSSSSYESGLVITGNDCSNNRSLGISLSYQRNFSIMGNSAIGINTSNTSDEFTIAGNKIISDKMSYGINVNSHTGASSKVSRIYNNFVSNSLYTGYGIYLQSCTYVNVDFNSVLMHTASVSNAAFNMLSCNTMNVRNNNFISSNSGLAMYITGSLPIVCNYNNLFTNGSNLVNSGGVNRANLASWKSASGKDNNSVSVDPIFFSNTDLHTNLITLDSVGTPVSGIATDIDGEARNNTRPDIGADEFNSLPNNLGVSAIVTSSNCQLDSQWIQVTVLNYGSNAQQLFKVKYMIDGVLMDSLTTSDTISSGQSRNYTFPNKYYFGSYGAFQFKAFTDLSSETYRLNDTFTKIIHNYQPVTSVGSMIPVDSSVNIGNPLTLSWSPVSGATLYDVYVWADSISTRPGSPLAFNLTQINTQITGLGYGVKYKWQVVARNPSCSADGPVQKFTMRNLPDLILTTVKGPTSGFSGNTINVSWVVKNNGAGSTISPVWYDYVYMSTDKTFDGSDQYLGGIANAAALNAGQSYSNNLDVVIPAGTAGKYYFIVRTDVSNSLLETDDGNNIRSDSAGTNISLTPPPDLQVIAVQRAGVVYSGSNVPVQYTVKNKGTGETRPDNWYDAIYLSKDTVFNGSAVYKTRIYHNSDLQPDSTYSASTTIKVPATSSGNHYIYVVTDYYNNVYEHSAENNNVGRSDTMDVLLTPPPDLVVDNIILPDTTSGRSTIQIQYNVINNGGSPTISGWYDRVYISSNSVFNLATATYVTDVYHAYLVNGDTLFTSRNIVVPSGFHGKCYAYVHTDFRNSVFEDDMDTNNIGRGSFISLSPDLIVPSVIAPTSDSSGKMVQINWRVANKGLGADAWGNRMDEVFISNHNKFIKDSVTSLKTVSYYTTLKYGDTIDKSIMVQIPNGTSGTQYFYVQTDKNDQIFENGIDSNNYGRSNPVSVILSPYPDLKPTALSVPDSSEAGSTAKVYFTVENAGNANAKAQWKDRIYLSKDSVFNVDKCITLSTTTRLITTAVSDDYVDSATVPIPGTVSAGNYYFYVYTDVENKLYEYVYEGNNVRRSGKVYVDGYPPIDLAITNITAPDSANSGELIGLNWTVTNIGDAKTLADFWTDKAYLSLDTIWSASDIFLGEVQRNVDVDKDSSYRVSTNFTVPNGTNGKYYLIVKADVLNANNDEDLSNNTRVFSNGGTSKQIQIVLSTSPDLKFSKWTIPNKGTSGQPLKIVWEVLNNGNGSTKKGSWVDKAFLSTDFNLDASDYAIGSKTHVGNLTVSGKYKDSAEFVIPSKFNGNYIIILITDETDREYEHNAENNNTVASAITIANAPPANLIVSSVSGPTTAISGANVTVNYTVKNIGANPAVGYMRDNVYISSDTVWDATDVLFYSEQYHSNLFPNISSNKSISKSVSGVATGTYYFIVYTDILSNINESNENDNIGYSNEMDLTIRLLPLETLVKDTLIKDIQMYYRMEIPDSLDGESILVTLKGDSINGNNEMFIRMGDVPSKSTFDFVSSAPFEGNQEILIPEVHTGTYYIMMDGESPIGSRQPITLYARKLNFEIRKVSPTSAGNNGQITLKIEGSKFTESTIFDIVLDSAILGSATVDTTGTWSSLNSGLTSLDNSGGVIVEDPTVAFATFKLQNASLGLYNVTANKEAEQAELKRGLRIVSTAEANLEINVTRPSNSRTNVVSTFKIDYSNIGNVDMVNGELVILSNAGAPISLTQDGLGDGLTSLTIKVEEENGPSGILRPKGTGSILIYTNSSAALGFTVLMPN